MTFRMRGEHMGALRRARFAGALQTYFDDAGFTTDWQPGSGVLTARDPLGRAGRIVFDQQGYVVSSVSAAGRTTGYVNRADGKLLQFTLPSGQVTALAYGTDGSISRIERDGQAVFEATANGEQYDCRYWDGSRSQALTERGRPTASTNRNGVTSRCEYDQAGRAVALVDGAGATTRFEYATDLSVTTTYADGRRERVAYDATGNRIAAWCDDERLYSAAYEGAAPTALSYADGDELAFARDGQGRPVAATAPAAKCAFAYDGDRLLEETCDDQRFRFEYDATGLVTSIEYPDGSKVSFGYEPDKRVAEVTDWSGRKTTLEHDRHDRYQFTHFPNGLVHRVTRHPSGKVAESTLLDQTQNALLARSFTYDLEGRLVTRVDAQEGTRQFYYDPESQLLGVRLQGVATEAYAYDATGNRTASQTEVLTYSAGNRLATLGGRAVEHDGRGNVTSLGDDSGSRFVYDLRNQLREVAGPNGSVRYEYDAFGRRVSKKSADTEVRFVWCGEQLLREIVTRGGVSETRDYLYLPGSFAPFALRIGDACYYFHTNPLGAPELLTDAAGRVVWAASYDACGGATVSVELVEQPLRVPGQYFDAETGLHYNRFRYYSPRIGRYLSPDPVGLPGGENLYLYAGNDPVNRTDPLGLFWKEALPWVVGAAAVAAVVLTAPVSAPLLAVAAVAGMAGLGAGLATHEALTQPHFCVPCLIGAFFKGAGMALGGLVVLALLPEELAAAAGIGLIALGAIGVAALAKNWDKMSPNQKTEAAGSLLGGAAVGAGSLGMAGPTLGGGLVVMSDGSLAMAPGVAVAPGAVAASGGPIAAMTANDDTGGGSSEPPEEPGEEANESASEDESLPRQSIAEREAEGGNPPQWAKDDPDNACYNPNTSRYESTSDEGPSRSTEFPSGYREGTHDAMTKNYTEEGQALQDTPRDANGNRIPNDQLNWVDKEGNPILVDKNGEPMPYYDENGQPNLTYDHQTSCAEMYNNGATVTDPEGNVTEYPPGNNTDRATRNDFYNDPNNLTPMTRSENSSKGSDFTYSDNPPGPDYEQ